MPPVRHGWPRMRGLDGEFHQRVISLEEILHLSEDEDVVENYGEGGKFWPLVSRHLDGAHTTEELASRVEHVFEHLAEEQAEMLRAAYIEGLTWRDLRRDSETKQAVHWRLKNASGLFAEEWVRHYE